MTQDGDVSTDSKRDEFDVLDWFAGLQQQIEQIVELKKNLAALDDAKSLVRSGESALSFTTGYPDDRDVLPDEILLRVVDAGVARVRDEVRAELERALYALPTSPRASKPRAGKPRARKQSPVEDSGEKE